jgi:hypothetical protein
MKTDIISVEAVSDNRVKVFVEAGDASSFHGFLRNNGILCTDLGPLQHVGEDLRCAFFAQGTMESFQHLISQWAIGNCPVI